MSVSYWMIEGIGLDSDKVLPYINKEKLKHMLLDDFAGDKLLSVALSNTLPEELDVLDLLDGELFDSLADLLTHCDDTNSITYGDDGVGGSYFYYPPSMPWHRTSDEPESIDEVHERIIRAVQKITDLSDDEISQMINDDLYVIGCG